MKVRIKGNSIRFRLLRSEIERFVAEGRVSESVQFGPDNASWLTYSLVASASARSISSRFENNEIVIEVPTDEARDWAHGDRVGLAAEHFVGDGTLSILIEKDFVCIDRVDDPDREDAFPNPTAGCAKGAEL